MMPVYGNSSSSPVISSNILDCEICSEQIPELGTTWGLKVFFSDGRIALYSDIDPRKSAVENVGALLLGHNISPETLGEYIEDVVQELNM